MARTNKKSSHPSNAYADNLQRASHVVQEKDAHAPAPITTNAESLGPDIAAGRRRDKKEHAVSRRGPR